MTIAVCDPDRLALCFQRSTKAKLKAEKTFFCQADRIFSFLLTVIVIAPPAISTAKFSRTAMPEAQNT
jgi:hypothetical protein